MSSNRIKAGKKHGEAPKRLLRGGACVIEISRLNGTVEYKIK